MARRFSITVDHNLCVGNSMCEVSAPKVFYMNEDRQSEVADPNADTEENIMEAAESCPVSAIKVVDADTGETLFP